MKNQDKNQMTLLELIHGDKVTLKPIVRPESASSRLEQKFLDFHEANPHIYDIIVQISRGLKAKGFKRAGMKMIFERLRWLWAIQTQGDDYKLNNNYTAFYARKVMSEVPELQGFFKVRTQRHATGGDAEEERPST